MIRRMLLITLGAVGVAGCADRGPASGIKADALALEGTARPHPYMAAGWKPGDRASWEQHLKVRTQGGQDEYAKIK